MRVATAMPSLVYTSGKLETSIGLCTLRGSRVCPSHTTWRGAAEGMGDAGRAAPDVPAEELSEDQMKTLFDSALSVPIEAAAGSPPSEKESVDLSNKPKGGGRMNAPRATSRFTEQLLMEMVESDRKIFKSSSLHALRVIAANTAGVGLPTTEEIDAAAKRRQMRVAGIHIDPRVMAEQVARLAPNGGFGQLLREKKMQTLVKAMGMPKFSGSGYHLTRIWLRYFPSQGVDIPPDVEAVSINTKQKVSLPFSSAEEHTAKNAKTRRP